MDLLLTNNKKLNLFIWTIIVFIVYVLYSQLFVLNNESLLPVTKDVMVINNRSHATENTIQTVNNNKSRTIISYSNNTNITKTYSNDIFNQTKVFKILFWVNGTSKSHTLGSTYFDMGLGKQGFQNCYYNNCMTTSSRNEYQSSDAVLFHLWLVDKNFKKKLPKKRPTKQKWIMFIGESPEMSTWARGVQGSFKKLNGLFNATWTYHRKSDIWTNYSSGYFQLKSKDSMTSADDTDYAAGKTRLVAWFVSNCKTTNKRMQYIHHLRKHVDIDIFGRCGNLSCKLENDTDCLALLNSTYKFYLAFENSLCEDYVTEKIWKIMPDINIIPVVMGRANYSDILPQHSYIDIGDFNSPEQLAEYMKLLNESDDLYNSYFQWKTQYEFVSVEPESCQLCRYLNEHENTTQVYNKLGRFWSAKSQCISPQVFYSHINATYWQDIKSKSTGTTNQLLSFHSFLLLTFSLTLYTVWVH